jgi:hypothetical protein
MSKARLVAHTIIPAFRRLQEDHKLEASLGYLPRPCLKKKRVILIQREGDGCFHLFHQENIHFLETNFTVVGLLHKTYYIN